MMKDLVRTVQIGKCPILMVQISMEGNGLNGLYCRKVERSNLVASDWMAL